MIRSSCYQVLKSLFERAFTQIFLLPVFFFSFQNKVSLYWSLRIYRMEPIILGQKNKTWRLKKKHKRKVYHFAKFAHSNGTRAVCRYLLIHDCEAKWIVFIFMYVGASSEIENCVAYIHCGFLNLTNLDLGATGNL